ncbi:PucR family transcriptional regulator [Orenia marismortui]|uniref:PucR family transcriptional regulator n=1 Tax=Orenia marismortui TaxID=46469 RepID=UPI000369CB32|nr:helix-turn-helix domain-containing protein [Orenia marismortui]
MGYLVILEENILDEDDYLALTQGVNAISLKLHQNYIIQSLSQRCSNELIENLLQGRVKDRQKLIKSGELAGWDLTVSYQLFVIKANFSRDLDKDTGGHGLYTYEMEEKIINSLHRIIRTNISRKYIIFSYQGDILLLINYEDNSKEIREDIESLHQQLSNRFQGVSFSIGGGSFVRDCCMIADSYQQALYSLEFLAITNEVNRVLFYEDLGVLRLLWQVDCRHLMKFTDEFLKELIAYDLNNNSNWVDTLGAFLQEGCSIQYAANRLHIHPNTMRYRIERIQEILGLDLRDFETQLNLTTAYKIHKFIICSCEEGG